MTCKTYKNRTFKHNQYAEHIKLNDQENKETRKKHKQIKHIKIRLSQVLSRCNLMKNKSR